MGSKDDFWDFKSNLSFVLLVLGGIFIFNVLYDSYDSYVREKEHERYQEINNLNKELVREQERERENNNNNQQDLKDKNQTENTDEPEKVRKIICSKCNGTGSIVKQCEQCNYNIEDVQQRSGGYNRYKGNGGHELRACRLCNGRGKHTSYCNLCFGDGYQKLE
jgi:hypothetical protein